MEKTELDYRLELIKLVSYCSTCHRNNTAWWMIRLGEYLNDINEFLGEKDRFKYDEYGMILTLKKGGIK